MKDIFVLGLTGPTGAGKSTVAAFFEKKGFAVINADETAKYVRESSSSVKKALADVFGQDLITDGSVDRKKLAERAFSSKEATEKLNAILLPPIADEIRRRALILKNDGAKAVILDAPLLFEAGLEGLCDLTVAVLSDRQVRLARIMERDGLSEDSAEIRMAAQPDDDFYRSRSDLVISNSDSKQELLSSLESIEKELGKAVL